MKFKFKRGSATKPGPIPIVRYCSKDHSDYPIYFDKFGNPRPKEETQQLIFGKFYQTKIICKCGTPVRFVKLSVTEVKIIDQTSLSEEELNSLNNGMEVCFDKDKHIVHRLNECDKK